MKSLKYLSKPIANRTRYWQNSFNEDDNIEGTDKVEYIFIACIAIFTVRLWIVTACEIFNGLINGDM